MRLSIDFQFFSDKLGRFVSRASIIFNRPLSNIFLSSTNKKLDGMRHQAWTFNVLFLFFCFFFFLFFLRNKYDMMAIMQYNNVVSLYLAYLSI